jgi:hypothetical protein
MFVDIEGEASMPNEGTVCSIKKCTYYRPDLNDYACAIWLTRLISHGKVLCEQAAAKNGGILVIWDERKQK